MVGGERQAPYRVAQLEKIQSPACEIPSFRAPTKMQVCPMPRPKILKIDGSMTPKPALQIVRPPQEDEDFFTAEMVAAKLHQTAQWVESKCRRRSTYPIPFHNIGNHRLFLMSEVREWVLNSPKVVHSRHRRRTKEEIAAAQRAKQKKAA